MNLVIVESPSKAKTINKYLGKDYSVTSSVGHIIDLPKSKLGVNVEKDFEPDYQVIAGKEKVIRELKSKAKGAEKIILATDPDREGEAISWHLQNVLKSTKKPIERITFHEITKSAVQEALNHPRTVDQNLVDAQQARRVLDRLVGYTLSPLLWKKIRYGLSAGRVQSVALRLIVDRERERQAFKAEEYWSVDVVPGSKKNEAKILKKLKSDEAEEKQKADEDENALILSLKKIDGKNIEITSEKDFDEVASDLGSTELKVHDVQEKQIKKRPHPPFTTSTFQQASVNVLGLSSRKAMQVAQKLYEQGIITYMRTDSFYLSEGAINDARKQIGKTYGKEFLPEKIRLYKNHAKNAQEAHEAIRPTSFEVKDLPAKLGDLERKVYSLIYRRTMASQMSDAIFTQKSLKISAKGNKDYELSSTAQRCDFEGWMKLYKISENQSLMKLIDSIKIGTILFSDEIHGDQHFTQPPPRYTEASLIKALEKSGIGRPSTYASIVSVIMQRTYAEKDGKYFYPTDTGFVVTDMLKKHFENIVDTEFTANMEQDLDHVADGKIKWKPFVKEFFIPFKNQVSTKDKEINKEDLVILGTTDEKCDICGKPMVKKLGKYGAFLSCSDFPKCQGIKNLDGTDQKDLNEKKESEEFKSTYKPAPKTDDGRDFLLKAGRYGEFWAHPDYPKVKDARPLEFTDEAIIEKFGEPPKASDGKKMILRSGKYGYFWAHPDYPEVKELQKIKKSKTEN